MAKSPTKVGLVQSIRKDPNLLFVSLASTVVPGLGQFINRQWAKGVLFLLVPLLFLGIEWGTGSWDKMDQGYKNDYVQYFGSVVQETLEAQSAQLGEATQQSAVLTNGFVDQVALAGVAVATENGVVHFEAKFGNEDHGYVISEAAALQILSAATGKSVTVLADADLSALSSVFSKVSGTLATQLGAFDGKAYVVTPGALVISSTSRFTEDSRFVVRVQYDLSLGDGDSTTYFEYFSPALAARAVGPLPKEGESRFPIRDYGGYISRGIWGMFSLGALVIGDTYRGYVIEASSSDTPWTLPDDSSKLLARGLIATVLIGFLLFAWVTNVGDAYASRRRYTQTGTVQGFIAYLKELWEKAYVWVLIGPSLVLIAFFTVIPFVYTFLCSFTNWTYKIYLSQQLISWHGITEYLTVFAEPAWLSVFAQVFVWTVIWAVASSVTVYIMGFAHALVIESPLVRGKKVWRTIMIIPWAMPALISLLAFRNVFDKDGLMNQILLATNLMKPVSDLLFGIGLEGRPDDIIFWFDPPYNANLAKFVAIMVNLWLGAPYFMMLMTGIMSTIPADRYEAAMIDGASAYQKFRYITLPLVVTATVPAMVMTVTFNFNNFGALYFLTGGGPTWQLENLPDALKIWTNSMPGQTDILISWIYKISFNANSQLYNKAAVFTVFIFLILGIFSVVNMRLTKAFDDEGEN